MANREAELAAPLQHWPQRTLCVVGSSLCAAYRLAFSAAPADLFLTAQLTSDLAAGSALTAGVTSLP